ncbi:MAG: hypothetical protein ACOCP4_03355 [Candidatus Woesearchaeota archaeon]
MTTQNQEISFDCSEEEQDIIFKIVERGRNRLIQIVSKDHEISSFMDFVMDITACHCNGNPLDLKRFLESEDFDFMHDFMGIHYHLDRETGQLKNGFLPRFASIEQNLDNERRENIKSLLENLIAKYIKVNEDMDISNNSIGLNDFDSSLKASAIRDVLTDLMHVADEHNLNINQIISGAEEVYLEEKEEKEEGKHLFEPR